jgi:hypothetical protein
LTLFSVPEVVGAGIEGTATASRACIIAGEFGCGVRGGCGAGAGGESVGDASVGDASAGDAVVGDAVVKASVAAPSRDCAPSGASGAG